MPEQPAPERLGRYRIVRELGKGAMGVVYEGLDPNIGRRVAIKTARRDVIEASGIAEEMMERFLREAQAAGALNHPNIITIYDAGEENGVAYIAMEYLEGGDLQDLIDGKQRFDVDAIVEIGATVCDALGHAHAKGIIHRDIKPANIMMPKDGPIRVADFGIAHVSDSSLTQEGVMIGTPHYMSPEQFMGHKVDGRSDLFAVGVILYELLTGEKPFQGEALNTVMHSVVKVEPIPPRELNFAIDECLNDIVMKALSKSPKKRYQTAAAMAAALRESLKEHPDPAITGVGDAEPAATLIGGQGDATVRTAPSADATVRAESTPDATIPGARIGSVAGERVVEGRAEGGKPARSRKRKWLIAMIVAAQVPLIIVIVAMLNRNSAEENAEGNYWGKVHVSVAQLDTPQQKEKYETEPKAVWGESPCEGATAVLKAVDDAETLMSEEVITNGEGMATLDVYPGEKSQSLWLVVSKEGFIEERRQLRATKPKQEKSEDIGLSKIPTSP